MHAIVALLLLAPADPASPAARLVGAALAGGHAYDLVQQLTDKIGPRLAGSANAERAVDWAVEAMKAAGLKNVHKEPVTVPHWVRGDAHLEVVAPSQHTLHTVALGGSVGTPGITAEVVEVSSLDDVAKLGARAKGKIILYNKAMPRNPHGDGYGQVVPMRHGGAIAAARAGAVGALIRSVGTGEYRLVHTGTMAYEQGVPEIPFASISAEDADLLHRLLLVGPVKVKLELGCQRLPDVQSSNVVGDVPGRENEVVLVGAHLDSWDLATGAIDDGAGCAIMLETARLIAALGTPRRTVRVVLYMNEENGVSGGHAYAERHAGELDRHVAAIEADSGAGRPFGFSVVGDDSALAAVRQMVAPLATLRAAEVTQTRFGGADIMPLQRSGVPTLGLAQDMSTYFDWHHTAADTLDKIDPLDLSMDVAAVAVLVHALADGTVKLPRVPPSSRSMPDWSRKKPESR